MNELFADIILFDTVCAPYTGDDLLTKGMGGSESQVIFLLEEFAKLGKKVICLNNCKLIQLISDLIKQQDGTIESMEDR